jgi:hypothetical protein
MAVHRPTDTERGYVAGLSCLASEPILLIARVCRRNQRPQHSTTRSASANAICLVGVGPPRGAPATAVSGVVRSRHVPSLGLGRQRRRHLRSGDDRALLHLPRRPGRRPPTPARRRRHPPAHRHDPAHHAPTEPHQAGGCTAHHHRERSQPRTRLIDRSDTSPFSVASDRPAGLTRSPAGADRQRLGYNPRRRRCFSCRAGGIRRPPGLASARPREFLPEARAGGDCTATIIQRRRAEAKATVRSAAHSSATSPKIYRAVKHAADA